MTQITTLLQLPADESFGRRDTGEKEMGGIECAVLSLSPGILRNLLVHEGEEVRELQLLAYVNTTEGIDGIRSPINGKVTHVSIRTGDTIANGEEILRLKPI